MANGKRWNAGDRLIHRLNPELGPGRVTAVEGRILVVVFPQRQATLRFAADSDALEPLQLRAGLPVRLVATGESATIDGVLGPDRVALEDGREVEIDEIGLLDAGAELIGRLAAGDVSSLESFVLRQGAMRLAELREADGLGSFLGGRIRIFPHQFYVAELATRRDPVRWLLADEVGLGKTVESCLVLNHLLHTGRAEQVLVVAPETLTVQWLGELWRKYHRIFVLLDAARLKDVARDHGSDFNPFDVHRQAVVSHELLAATPKLAEQAVEVGIDLLVVDEAHHLRRRRGHPGNALYRAIAPIAALERHVLLLTAVPLEDDAHGFFRLLQLLLPQAVPDWETFEEHLDSGVGLPACTSATRRVDIGGLPPRLPAPVDVADDESFGRWERAVEDCRGLTATTPVARREKAVAIRRALAAVLAGDRTADAVDPRVSWLAARARRWQSAGEKTLVFVGERSTLEDLRGALARRTTLHIGVFHEDLSTKQRDIEVAQFRLPEGPSLLLSTECGGEGRNFEFCTRLVLFDLPWSPMVVEQRIGRLDRIGRRMPVEIVYFRPPRGIGRAVVRLYEQLGLFERPLTSIETELRSVEGAIEDLALRLPDESTSFDEERFEELLAEARRGYDRVERAAYHELHSEPYRSEMANGILDRVPPELEEITRDVVVAACRELGLQVEESQQGRRHWIELDARARIESLPGIAGEASFLGTFWRQDAVEDETLEFFASGHPLVEGILAHLEESPIGRVALLHLPDAKVEPGFGLLALYQHGPDVRAVVVDGEGRERPDWRAHLLRRPLRSRRVRAGDWTGQPAWPDVIRRLGRFLDPGERPVALAAVRMGSPRRVRS